MPLSAVLRDEPSFSQHRETPAEQGCTYFGATGCGKTYTMLFLSRYLALREDSVGSPTIVILVDREDLQDQTSKLFMRSAEYLSNGEVREIESRADLANELKVRESGGVFICTIQKFSEGTGLVNDRSNIICFSDEAHVLRGDGTRERQEQHHLLQRRGAPFAAGGGVEAANRR